MADEVASSTPVEAPAPVVDAPTESAEPAQTNGDTKTPEDKKEETQADVEHAKIEESVVEEEKAQDAEPASSEPPADGTPGGSKDKKRKSVGGVPEHKSKKLNKKKSMPTLRLECKPGEFYWARLKGYPPWPAIICDESMLPESLLASRPVSTARPDGSLRADFEEGGKNAKERTFPIMFLHTNEFQWMVNTALTPLDPEECKTLPKTKMTKALQEAYKVASEDHDIEYFKKLLRVWQDEEEAIRKEQEEFAAEQERLAAEQAAKAEKEALEEETKEKPKKKAARKSKGGDDDIDMEDAEAPKSTKKRKKDAESGDDDAPKAKKTPKVKLNAPKTPNGEASASKKSTTKPKKKVVTAPKQESEEEKPQMTEAERLAQREKAILYLRHRLQKGFLSRDQAPKEEEMEQMAEFFTQLESYDNLEPSIIRTTKIHKVLKAIVKLASVPKDDQFSFKKRSGALLEIWNKRMEAEGDAPKSAVDAPEEKEKSAAVEDKAPETNGAKEPEKEIAKDDQAEAKQDAEEGAAKPAEAQEVEMKDAEADEKPAETETEKKADEATEKIEAKIEEKVEEAKAGDDKDGDVSMQATETA